MHCGACVGNEKEMTNKEITKNEKFICYPGSRLAGTNERRALRTVT
jgi:hypothetical protein